MSDAQDLKTICALTTARNEPGFVQKWVAHYGAALGAENLFVLLDGHDQPVLYVDGAVLQVKIAPDIIKGLRGPQKTQHTPAQNGARHDPDPSRYHSTTKARSASVISVTLPGGIAWLQPA